MAKLNLSGRILFLSADPDIIRLQLEGANLTLETAGSLRDDVSTDEITPMSVLTQFDERLGEVPYVGFHAGGEKPIAVSSVRRGKFCISVGGDRYGKGSSREHSPLAEYSAGIRLVIARSFERIYRQNADNLGLFTSTDLGLLKRVQSGESIDIEELLASRDELAAAILRHGGLLKYGAARMKQITGFVGKDSDKPRTLFQKILERNILDVDGTSSVLSPGTGRFVRADWRFIHEYYTGMAAHMLERSFGEALALYEPESILAFEDHLSYSHLSELHVKGKLLSNVHELSNAHRRFTKDHNLVNHGYLNEMGGDYKEGSEGISHAMMSERYVLPGQVVVGTDSHTPHSGALGCVAFGVGTTDMSNAFVTGAVRITIPESVQVNLFGELKPGVTAKDVVLHLLADPSIRAGSGVGKAFEFAGAVVSAMTTDERTTLTNMTAELGGFTGIVAPDAETVRFLKERRGIDFAVQPWMRSDEGASYATVIEVDCSSISPMLAAPGDPGNGVALSALCDRPMVDIAYGGSCTAGKREDFDHYYEVLSWAAHHGLRVPQHTKLFLQFGTSDVREYCIEQGYIPVFEQVGAILLQPSCGACANCGPGSSTDSSQVTISAINRNFGGRSGPGKVWLASPPTVAASAIAGVIKSFSELQNSFLKGGSN